MAPKRIDISSDMGESFGNYRLGDDEGVMKYITSANIACGFHAGDPSIMRRTVLLAKKHGVAVGAHVGLPDLLGFGRRVMEISPEECRDYVVYQVGALRAFAEACGLKLNHATVHGALTTLSNRHEGIATAIVEAIQEVDPALYFMSRPGLLSFEIGKKLGLRVRTYAAVDMRYYRDGRFALERQKKAVDIPEVIRRAKSLLHEGRVEAVDGGYFEISPDTLLVHGDNPQAVETLKALRAALEEDGLQITHP